MSLIYARRVTMGGGVTCLPSLAMELGCYHTPRTMLYTCGLTPGWETVRLHWVKLSGRPFSTYVAFSSS